MRLRKRTYSIAEVAALTGLTVDAVRGRVKRGSLASVVKEGRRRIPHAELERAGLLPAQAWTDPAAAAAWNDRLPARLAEGPSGLAPSIVVELLDRLERQSIELAHYRALDAAGDNGRLLQELAHLRARVAVLEGAPAQGALPAAGRAGEAGADPSVPRLGSAAEPSEPGRLWLPPTVGARSGPAEAGPRPPAFSQPPAPILPTLRAARFALEAFLILAAALAAWLGGLGVLGIILVVGAVWLVVALAEFAAWQLEAV